MTWTRVIRVVILKDACASRPFDGFLAQEAHAFALARFCQQFGQKITAMELSAFTGGAVGASARSI